eukprot:GHVO01049542.1.p1 GENE.GHVO01049542.1~~GHVO01049542.1.p1  ORF type:complete len:370 (+),score=96.51 GHVO01049542.1:1247-2356(+)
MKLEIEELRNRETGAPPGGVTATESETLGSSDRRTSVIAAAVVVRDLSEDDRRRMEEERRLMDEQRMAMKGEREAFEAERDAFIEERKKAQEDKIVLQGELVDANKETAVWQAKYEGLREQLGDLADIRAKYEALQIQMKAVAAMAAVSSDQDRQKADVKIEKAEQNRVVMEEEKQGMENDLAKWKEEFTQSNGRDPSEADKPDSIRETEVSLNEADLMINKLNTEIDTYETLKRGDVPQPPVISPTPIEVKDTEVKVVEVKVPDPEVLAQLEMTQEEVEALRKQLMVLKNDAADQESKVQRLQGEAADATWQLDKTTTEKVELERQRDALVRELSDSKGVADPEEIEALKMSISIFFMSFSIFRSFFS